MIDSVAAVSFDMVAQGATSGPAGSTPGKVSVHDLARFQQAMNKPAETGAANAESMKTQSADGFASVLKSLQSLNGRVEALGDSAVQFAADKQELTPGDMIQMTVRCHQFMFQCELTANVANRSSEGVQQLFRQQS